LMWEIKNISDGQITIGGSSGYTGFGNFDCRNESRPSSSSINVTHFTRADNSSHKLDPGSTLSGTVEVKAGSQLIFVCKGSNINNIEIKVRGNFVADEFSGYSTFNLDKDASSYGNYRTITYYSDNGTTQIASKSGAPFVISNEIGEGTYDAYYRVSSTKEKADDVWGVTRNNFVFGAVNDSTETNCYYAGGIDMYIGINLWHKSQITIANSGMTTVFVDAQKNALDGTDTKLILKMQEVVTE